MRCLLSVTLALTAAAPFVAAAERDDDKALRDVADRFFAAYASKDLNAFMALWSEKSPEYQARKQNMTELFAKTGPIEVKSLTVARVHRNGDAGSVRMSVELAGNDLKTGKLHPALGKLDRVIDLAREGGRWKVMHYGPSRQRLMERLADAPTKAERLRLLDDDSDLIEPDFVLMILDEGDARAERGNFDRAARLQEVAFEVAGGLRDKSTLAWCHVYRGLSLEYQSRYEAAVSSYQKALPLFREAQDREGEGVTLYDIGRVYTNTGRYAEALQQFQDSLKIKRELKDRAGEARNLNTIGLVYTNTGRYAEALQQFQDSLKIKRELKDRAGEAGNLNNIGVVYELTERYAEALQQYQDSLKIKRELKDRAGEARNLNNIGVVYELTERHAEAREQFRAALEITKALDFLDLAVMCHGNLGRTFWAQGQWREAIEDYSEAVRLTELLRINTREPTLQTSLLAQKIDPYFRLVQCRLELHESDKAFTASEGMKARGLVDILQQGKADLRRGMSDEERKVEQTLQNQVTALGVELEGLRDKKADLDRQTALARDLGKARQDLEAFRRDIYLHRPDLATRRAEFASASLKDLGSAFAGRPGLVVLSYLVGEKETLLFVLTAPEKEGGAARLTVHRLDVGSKELVEAAAAFREACSDPEKGEPVADDLYRWLIAPAADELVRAKRVVVIPDDVLHTLPFQALRDSDGKYLIERFAVSYAPSVTALMKMEELGERRRKQYAGRPASLLAVAVSDFGRRERPLPAATPEAKAVADLFGDDAKLLPGAEATLAKLEASWSGRRYLHFATHGRLNPDAPLYSSLVLSPGRDGDEGVLYARDLVDADVPAELVVMSACQTGLGRHVWGEGLLGLSWAWFAAGVPSTVASQWSVGDDSTARLMKAFYARLKAGDSKAEALRQAELSLLKDDGTKNPFYWAPFVLVGDDR